MGNGEFKIPCVRCGACCMTSACPYGTWDAEKNQCSELSEVMNDLGQRDCLKYDEISASETSWISPAFGGGCSSSLFNRKRGEVIEKLRHPRKNLVKELSVDVS